MIRGQQVALSADRVGEAVVAEGAVGGEIHPDLLTAVGRGVVRGPLVDVVHLERPGEERSKLVRVNAAATTAMAVEIELQQADLRPVGRVG